MTAVSREEATQADIVFLAVNWNRLEVALKGLGPWNGPILVDANNAVEVPSYQPVDLGGRASTQAVAEWAPGARVVEAFNHLVAAALEADPKVAGGRRVHFVAGEDAEAKKTLGDLIAKLGYVPIDLGGVQQSRLVQRDGPLATVNLVRLDE